MKKAGVWVALPVINKVLVWISSLLFSDDVVFIGLGHWTCNGTVCCRRWHGRDENKHLKLNVVKVLNCKLVACHIQVGRESMPQVGEFKYFGVCSWAREGCNYQADWCSGSNNAVNKYLWFTTESTRSCINVADMSFTSWMTRCTLRDRVRSLVKPRNTWLRHMHLLETYQGKTQGGTMYLYLPGKALGFPRVARGSVCGERILGFSPETAAPVIQPWISGRQWRNELT